MSSQTRNFNIAWGRRVLYWKFWVHCTVSEWVQVNPNNSWAISTLTFLSFKLNTLQKEIVKPLVSWSHGVMTVVWWIYTTAIIPRYLHQRRCFLLTQYHVVHVQISQSEDQNSYIVWKLNNKMICYIALSHKDLKLLNW